MATRWHGNRVRGDAREPRGRRDRQRYRCEGAARVHNNRSRAAARWKRGVGGEIHPPSPRLQQAVSDNGRPAREAPRLALSHSARLREPTGNCRPYQQLSSCFGKGGGLRAVGEVTHARLGVPAAPPLWQPIRGEPDKTLHMRHVLANWQRRRRRVGDRCWAPVGGVDAAFSISPSFSISFSRTLIYSGVAASNFYE